MAKVFSPHNNVPALDVYKISGNLNLPKTSAITISNYLHKKEDEDVNCPIALKLNEMNKNLKGY